MAVTKTKSGAKVYLCAACVGYLKAERYAQQFGLVSGSRQRLAALAAVLSAPLGYRPPGLFGNSRAAEIWHALTFWEKSKIVRRVRSETERNQPALVIFARRDACLDCLRSDGTHSDTCALVFGEQFTERKEVL